MYLLNVKAHYDAAHFLRSYRGKCEKLHGHRYVVEAALAFDELGEGGMAYDFSEAKLHLRALAEQLDHENLNELEAFRERETSAENQAHYIYHAFRARLGPAAGNLLWIRVWETPDQWAQYSERDVTGIV